MAFVEFETPEVEQNFGYLKEGTYFQYQGNLYIKTFFHDDDGCKTNAYNLSCEEFDYLIDITMVSPISSTRIEILVLRRE